MKKIGHQFWCLSCCFTRLQPRELLCTQHVPGSASALGRFSTLSKTKDFDRLGYFFKPSPPPPRGSLSGCSWPLGAQHLLQSEGTKGSFLAGGTVCTCISTFRSKGGQQDTTEIFQGHFCTFDSLPPLDSITQKQIKRKDCEQQRTYREQ